METPNANDELKSAAQFSLECMRCNEHYFTLLPTGHTKCSTCGLIYSYVYAMKKWVFTSTDVFEERLAIGEEYSDIQKRFIPIPEKIQEAIDADKRKKRREAKIKPKRKDSGEDPKK